MKNRDIIKMFPALAALLILGCVKDYPIAPPEPVGNDVTITVSIPGQQTPSTRSIAGGDGEANLASIDVLVFKPAASGGHELVQHVRGNNILPTGGADYQVQFKAKLWADAAASTVVLVANVPDMAGLIGTQTDKRVILARLTYASANPGGASDGWKWKADASDYTPIPMYGEYAIASGGVKAGMRIEGISLRRMLARVDVENAAAGFELTDVYMVNYNTAGYIAPAWNIQTGAILESGDDGYPYESNENPLLPGSPGTQKGEGKAMHYAYPATGGLTGKIYTYETVATSGAEGTPGHTYAPCLIVQGTYGGHTYYYRIDFTAGADADGKKPGEAGFNPAAVGYMPLYRNYRYDFTISRVDGPGYLSFGDALKSLGIMNNLKTDLLVVDESSVRDIVYNGRHYLGIGSGEVMLGPLNDDDIRMACTTNYAYGWQVNTDKGMGGIEYKEGGTGWLQATKEGGAADMKSNLHLKTITDNAGGVIREAWVHIKAGTLNHKVKVRQDYAVIRAVPSFVVMPGPGIMNAGYPVEVSCKDSRGNQVNAPWSLTVPTGSWVRLSLTQNEGVQTTVQGTGSATVYLFASPNPSGTDTRTSVMVSPVLNLTVSQSPYDSSDTPVAEYTYVGAFWRANQMGERLIRITGIQGAGSWIAQVLEYGDFQPDDIVLSDTPSSDGNVWTAAENIDMNNPANDAAYSVSGNRQVVTGTIAAGGEIFFRIGLTTRWDSSNPNYDPAKPARYAVIALSYKNNALYQKIYLRQGHEADYVMRQGDPNSGGSQVANNRYYACKFVPYNLTHPDLKSGANTGGSSMNHPTIPARANMLNGYTAEDYFTAYPSQAGAFFQWANASQPRKAYHPTNPAGSSMTGWPNSWADGYWNTLEAAHETCPPGYRRPNDGSTSSNNTSGNVNSSEVRQSLWRDPVAASANSVGNSIWGYYADGFFDRRAIGNPEGITATPNSAVSATTGAVAYAGRLFFNPTTNASLFMPASSYRYFNSGQIFGAGGYGYYWTTSFNSSISNSWVLNLNRQNARMDTFSRSYGISVRCVRE